LAFSKRRRSRWSSAKLRTTRTPARLVCRTALSRPSTCWLARVLANICREKCRVVTIMNGIITSDTAVSRTLIPIITCRALANAKTTLATFSTPKPSSRRTCCRSPVERLMISPADMVR
jgi:hypothetical protein